MPCGWARFAHMHYDGENLANFPHGRQKSTKMLCHRAELAHMRYGGSTCISMRCGGGGLCSHALQQEKMLPHALCDGKVHKHALWHGKGPTCTMVGCNSITSPELGETSQCMRRGAGEGGGAMSGRMPYGGARTATMPLCGACHVVAQIHAKCPTVHILYGGPKSAYMHSSGARLNRMPCARAKWARTTY